ncbi:NAD(P)-binding domain-containing protein [Pseudomonas aeruginosa]|uniref:NAD(P)-binding domain-containing protein n=1 Tax=Pseudomonas aeruginosa TaxID=287 RepID=UPI002159C966|nr:NAD(P)-binding domain-containing protein [Pseudomonas aeruginosa]
MSYAIIGFGKIGQALAKAFARKNIDVTVASRRPPEARRPGPITTDAYCCAMLQRRVPPTTSAAEYGSPEFTNEVQHFQLEVLPWGGLTSSSPWRSDARLPGFRPVAARSGKSRQLWIARHQRSLGS